MRDLVFLFGAGASFGAGSIVPERPPLGASLFQELRRTAPGSWGALPTELAAAFAQDFESAMAEVSQRYGEAVAPLMRDMAVYFVQFRPASADCLYATLVRNLKASRLLHRSLLSTLNYECVLEFCVNLEGAPVAYSLANTDEEVPVLKLHGSCNMFSATIEATPGITFSGVTFEGGIRIEPDVGRVIEHCLTGTALSPVMCLYMEGKPTITSPGALRELQLEWQRAVASARAIVCIGVRPHLPDQHIWDCILSAPGRLLFAGDRLLFDAHLEPRSGGVSEYLGATFADALPHITSRLESL